MTVLALDLVRSRRVLLVAICAGLLFVSVGYLALYPSLEGQLKTFADDLPDAYKALLGDVDIATAEGYIRSQVYSLIAPLLIAGAAISAGSSLAKAERDQTLAVLVVTPLSRRRVAGAWWLLVACISLLGAATTVIGVVIGAPLASADVSLDRIALASLPLFLFALLIGGVSLLVATTTGAPGTATGAGWVTILVSFIANSLAELIDSLGWLADISPWSWHGAGEAITTDFDNSSFYLLVITALLVGSAAIASFERRNLHL